jgi:predicted HAD superfamily phosphohydrolase
MNQKQKEIKNKIDTTTDDLDIRQSIWIEYLETDNQDIDFICKKLILQKKATEEIEEKIKKIANSEKSDSFIELLESFTEFEQSVLSLLFVGVSINSVAKYKMIKPMRIVQVIHCISSSSVWREYFAEKNSNAKRKIRLKQ